MKVIASEDGTPMSWPDPHDGNKIEWKLRYGDPTRGEVLQAAAYIAAYRYLIEIPQRLRNQRVGEIRKAAKEDE